MTTLVLRSALALALFLGSAFEVSAQSTWEQGGFLENSAVFSARRPYPSDTHAAGSTQLQLWARSSLHRRLSVRGSLDFRLDTHHDIDRRRWTDASQRGVQQPAGSIGEFYLDVRLGRLDLRVGKQEIRWGRADGFNPTDNLIPYDYLDLFADRRIAVPSIKGDLYVGRNRLESVWIPFYTPTRLPLLGQRWFPQLPETALLPVAAGAPPVQAALSYHHGRTDFPARTWGNSQWGVRWNQIVRRAEFSVSYFDGFDDIATFRSRLSPAPELSDRGLPHYRVALDREFYRVRVAGVDFASELGPFGIRGEAGYFDRTDPDNRDHLLFVVGIDRSWGDWFVILQYAGQKVSGESPATATFPDLGLRSTLLYRIERTISASSRLELKGAVRLRDGDLMVQPEYSVALSNNWRLTLGAVAFAGSRSEFLGQYAENARASIQLRYSF
jgi:hypothetical protein